MSSLLLISLTLGNLLKNLTVLLGEVGSHAAIQ